jgi:hypothetical protein
MDYFVHVLSSRKTRRTTEGTWTLEQGQTLFFKKVAAVLYITSRISDLSPG